MEPCTEIWIGYPAEDLEGRLAEEILTDFQETGEVEVDGLVIKALKFTDDRAGYGDERVGYGVMLLQILTWNTREVDLAELARKAEELKAKVAAAFRSWGIEDEPKVVLVTDLRS